MSYLCFILIVIIPGCFSSMNIGKGKTATQSSDHNSVWRADKAVDGFINRNGIDRDVTCDCCSQTAVRRTEAFWQVDLETTSRIQNVTIYYRKLYTYRFAGFSLYVSNTSRTKEKLCFKHTGNALPDPIKEIDCPSTARYVYFYNERLSGTTYPASYSTNAVIELCEVEVYGCPLMKYGDTCSEDCSVGCNNNSYVCEPDTGDCISDCRTGFTGSRCDECIVGFYDVYCNKSCSDGCLDVSCNRFNGKCEKGCKENFSGDRCRDCIDGKHGDKCDLDCSENCFNNTCHQTTGDCRLGCYVNWEGSQCQVCADGYYGITCTPCFSKCVTHNCRKDNGYCNYGCQDSSYGDICNKSCPTNCKNNKCDQKTGYCTDGCHSRSFLGRKCNVCVTGFYGKDCDTECPEYCNHNMCDGSDGTCILGCKYKNMTGNQCDGGLTETKDVGLYIGLIICGIISAINFVFMAIILILCIKRRRRNETSVNEIQMILNTPQTDRNWQNTTNIEQQEPIDYEGLILSDVGNVNPNSAEMYMSINLTEVHQSESA